MRFIIIMNKYIIILLSLSLHVSFFNCTTWLSYLFLFPFFPFFFFFFPLLPPLSPFFFLNHFALAMLPWPPGRFIFGWGP